MRLFLSAVFFAFVLVSSPAISSAPQPSVVVVSTAITLFSSEDAAQQHCPRDVIVWLNLSSKIYHYKGERWYGRTRHGAFVCEKEAIADGDRASRNGQ